MSEYIQSRAEIGGLDDSLKGQVQVKWLGSVRFCESLIAFEFASILDIGHKLSGKAKDIAKWEYQSIKIKLRKKRGKLPIELRAHYPTAIVKHPFKCLIVLRRTPENVK
jgi:hypothetical protein